MTDQPLVSSSELNGLAGALMGAAVDAIIVIDVRGIVKHFSPSAEELFGFQAEEVIGNNVSMLMPEPDASRHDHYLNAYQNQGRAKIIGIGRDVRGKKANGTTFPMHLSVGKAVYEGAPHFVGICHDLTEYHEALHQAARSEQRYREILQSQKQFICRIDSDFHITFANASFSRTLGFDEQSIVGAPLTHFLEDDESRIRLELQKLFEKYEETEEVSVKVTFRSSLGFRKVIDWTFRQATETSTGAVEAQGFGIDISEKEAAVRQAEFLRNHDAITGFFTRSKFVNVVDGWLANRQRAAFIKFGCDNFFQVSQNYSHEVGKKILVDAAARLKRHLDRPHICGKTGADGFITAIELHPDENPLAIARKLLDAVCQPFDVGNEQLQLDGRVGLVLYPEHVRDVAHAPDLAESARRSAQRANQLVGIFDWDEMKAARRKIEIEQRLKLALTNNELTINLQPKYTVSDGTIIGFEALVRWNSPELGPVSPGEFVPIAEQSRLGWELDRYVLHKVLSLIHEASAGGRSRAVPPIAVNITASQFGHSGFAEFILEEIRKHDVLPPSIELEITEGVILQKPEQATENLTTLRHNGIRVAIDDFGTGYSSLSYLRDLDVDLLKIDRSFITEMSAPEGEVLMCSIINIAKAHGIAVVAEGVETRSQLDQLRSMKCDFAQGYYLSKPLPADEALALIPAKI
ncbi:MAG: EAL domain-containing protein [Alteromonadaceae bacterium]|nr:EAL domain-containing protein [Alteromonadaceae bacterium]